MSRQLEIIFQDTKKFNLAATLLKRLVESKYELNDLIIDLCPLHTYEEIRVITDKTRRIMIFDSASKIPDGDYEILYKQFNITICKDEYNVVSILVMDKPVSKLQYSLLLKELMFVLTVVDQDEFNNTIKFLEQELEMDNFFSESKNCYGNSIVLAIMYYFVYFVDDLMMR